jgi:hypothetical protein
MSKLSIILGSILSLAACNKQAPVAAPALAGEIICEQVYHHVVYATYVDYVLSQDTDHVLTDTARQNVAISLVDKWCVDNGLKDRFLQLCNMQMTVPQSECAMRAEHLHDISACMKQGKQNVK